jgi:hypothetical protein
MTRRRRRAPAQVSLRVGTPATRATVGATLPASPAAVEDWLAESGLLDELLAGLEQGTLASAAEEAFSNVLAEAEAYLATVRSALDAEMWGSEMLGIVTSSGFDLSAAEDFVADAIVPMAEEAGTPPALAMLVVLGGIAGPRLSSTAAVSRRRPIERGVPEPAWAEGIGAPTVGPCWVYGDVFGGQESVTATFAYGRARHALCVLIDHNLGGGVKDSYVVGRVPTLRRRMFDMASDDGATFCEEVAAADAAHSLRQAMACPECPWLSDQVEDVARTRALLRSRVALMLAPA